jgi:hypothetical protein
MATDSPGLEAFRGPLIHGLFPRCLGVTGRRRLWERCIGEQVFQRAFQLIVVH